VSYEFAYQSGYSTGHAVAEKKAADRILELEVALRRAADDLRIIQTLPSHGADMRTYIGWLRSNAYEAERRAWAVLYTPAEQS
jgi:hypothetical protein